MSPRVRCPHDLFGLSSDTILNRFIIKSYYSWYYQPSLYRSEWWYKYCSPSLDSIPSHSPQCEGRRGSDSDSSTFVVSVRIYQVFYWEKEMSEKKIWRIFYPDIQHLKTPPLARHFRAKMPNSAFKQFNRHLVGWDPLPAPGIAETKSKPYFKSATL